MNLVRFYKLNVIFIILLEFFLDRNLIDILHVGVSEDGSIPSFLSPATMLISVTKDSTPLTQG